MLQKTAQHVVVAEPVPAAAQPSAAMALTGKLALVTGASSGIGLSIAKMFVAEGVSHLSSSAPRRDVRGHRLSDCL